MALTFFKSVFITLQALLLAFITYAESAMYVLIFLFIGNIFFGILADILKEGNQFKFKKFLRAVGELAIYFTLVIGAVIIIHFQKEWEIGSYVIKSLTYLFIYAYGTNILRNLEILLPNNVVIRFLYYCLSFEFVKKIPFFVDFQEKEKEKEPEPKKL